MFISPVLLLLLLFRILLPSHPFYPLHYSPLQSSSFFSSFIIYCCHLPPFKSSSLLTTPVLFVVLLFLILHCFFPLFIHSSPLPLSALPYSSAFLHSILNLMPISFLFIFLHTGNSFSSPHPQPHFYILPLHPPPHRQQWTTAEPFWSTMKPFEPSLASLRPCTSPTSTTSTTSSPACSSPRSPPRPRPPCLRCVVGCCGFIFNFSFDFFFFVLFILSVCVWR